MIRATFLKIKTKSMVITYFQLNKFNFYLILFLHGQLADDN